MLLGRTGPHLGLLLRRLASLLSLLLVETLHTKHQVLNQCFLHLLA